MYSSDVCILDLFLLLFLELLVEEEKVDDESLKIRDTAAMELGKLLFQKKRAFRIDHFIYFS